MISRGEKDRNGEARKGGITTIHFRSNELELGTPLHLRVRRAKKRLILK